MSETPAPRTEPDRRENCIHAYVLIAVTLVALGQASGQWLLVGPFFVFLASHLFLQGLWHPKPGLVGYLLLSLPFALLANSMEVLGATGPFRAAFSLYFYVSLVAILAAILQLYQQPHPKRWPFVLVMTGVPFAVAGSVLPTATYLRLLIPWAVASVLVLRDCLDTRVYAKKRRWLVWAGVTAAFLLTVSVTLYSGRLLQENFNRLAYLFYRMQNVLPLERHPGFSTQARLGTITDMRQNAGRRLALRAYADEAPGYLRGKVFPAYGSNAWLAGTNGREASVDRGENKDKPTGRFDLPGRLETSLFARPNLTVYPEDRYGAHFFLPLKTSGVETASRTVLLFHGNALQSRHVPTTRGYDVFTDANAVFDPPPETSNEENPNPLVTEKTQRAYVALPPGAEALRQTLDDVIRQMQNQDPQTPPDEPLGYAKARYRADPGRASSILQNWFLNRYTYKIGIRFDERPGAPDVMVQFLETKTHGHCELFASAGALVLRRIGIPARYVTGFVCVERSPYDERLYLARDTHGHAWVEMLHPDKGWQTVEFTPPDGQPQAEIKKGTAALWEYLGALWQRMIAYFKREGLSGILTVIAYAGNWLIDRWYRIVGLLVLIALYFWRRRFRKARADRRAPRELPADLEAQRQAFYAMEKRLRRRGLGKTPDETLEEYAARLEAAAFEEKDEAVPLVRAFAAARYAPFAT